MSELQRWRRRLAVDTTTAAGRRAATARWWISIVLFMIMMVVQWSLWPSTQNGWYPYAFGIGEGVVGAALSLPIYGVLCRVRASGPGRTQDGQA